MRKCALIILDGWGHGDSEPYNAIHMANTPYFDKLWDNYPRTTLEASGEFVGLPKGQIGGSEVGHLTIGAGRVFFQSLPRISRAFERAYEEDGILQSESFAHLLRVAKENPIHMIGLISHGGVHSHSSHLLHLLEILKKEGCKNPYIHVITDGRDTPPHSAKQYLKELVDRIDVLGFGRIVTMSGRFYAMDRDKNWIRTEKASALVVNGTPGYMYHAPDGWKENLFAAIEENYARGISDEFFEPMLIDQSYSGVGDGECVFFLNFRSDRMKQLVTQIAAGVGEEKIITMMKYDKDYPYSYLFDKEMIENTLSEFLSSHHLTQLKAAETEKAAHVTYFFNGGVEITFDGEVRAIAESNKIRHDEKPEMKAVEIEQDVVDYVSKHHPDFILVNFANPDMVGHTGIFEAVVKGVETVDAQLEKLCEYLKHDGYVCLITADHGNADIMWDPQTKEPHTAHTLNPVPFILYGEDFKEVKLDQAKGIGLDRIAGTVCEVMGLVAPEAYSNSLIIKQ